MPESQNQDFTQEQQDVLNSVRMSKVIFPIIIGVLVVFYLLWQNFDPEEFAKIEWTSHAFFWIGVSFLFLALRHLAYSLRLRILSEGDFSWSKCIELIFIWEFSSAVSPTSVGGSAVALFALSQEKIGGARTSAIVLYTIVADTLFFIGTLPILLLIFGPNMIRPELGEGQAFDGWFYTFIAAYTFMAMYGAFFFYGLFVDPKKIRKIAHLIARIPFLKKFKDKLLEIGEDFLVASRELKKKQWKFHLSVFLSTALAWSLRFLLLNCLIIAIVETTVVDLWTQFALYARLQTMFVIMAFSPTPGGAGFAEIVFGGFLSDYVPVGLAVVAATLWRILTYYSYLLMGVIIIPNWIRNILKSRGQRSE